jgi:hypothetical protein
LLFVVLVVVLFVVAIALGIAGSRRSSPGE